MKYLLFATLYSVSGALMVYWGLNSNGLVQIAYFAIGILDIAYTVYYVGKALEQQDQQRLAEKERERE